jgi:Protein of unknown function (DUF4235)
VGKALYKPLSILFSLLAGVIAGKIFKQVWKLISDEEEAPRALENEYGWREILPAALLQGAILALVKVVVQRSGARGVEKLTGYWPGD